MEKVFEALASTPRRKILAYLSRDELSAGEIAARFEMSKPAISKHLQILENAGLVTSEKRGQFVWYSLRHEQLNAAIMHFLQTVAPSDEPVGLAPPPPARKPRNRDEHARR